jgi:hypothetical protein
VSDSQTSAERLAELLTVARNALTEDILPMVPPERRYTAPERPAREALERLLELYDELVSAEAPAEGHLERLEWRLAEDIRAGVYDSGPARDLVAAYLDGRTRAQVAISNPRYLEAPG